MFDEILINELKAISEERGYGNDFGINFKKWQTKDETRKRIYITINFGGKTTQYYIDMINKGISYNNPRISLEKELVNRIIPILVKYEEDIINKYL